MAYQRLANEMKDSGYPFIGQIPIEWKVVSINSIKDIDHPYPIGDGDHGQISPNDYLSEGIPYIRVQNLSWGGPLNLENVVYISKEINDANSKSILKPNDILVAKTGATIGKTAIIPTYVPIANTTSSVGKLTVSPKYSSKYVFYVLSSDVCYIQMWIKAGQKTAQPGFNIEDLAAFRIPFPDPIEQQSIADYLDNYCARIDDVIVEATASIEEYRILKQAIIDEALSGYNEIHIKMRQLGTLKNGLNFTYSDDEPNIMFLGVGCVKDNMVLDNKEQFSDIHIDFDVSEEYLLKDGDIVFVRSNGSKELVGRSVMVNNVDYPLTFSGFCIRFRNERTDLVLNEYLLYFFRTLFFRQSLLKFSNDSTNINNLNQEMLNTIRINAPNIEKQTEIVNALRKRIETIDSLIAEKQALVNDLASYKKSLIFEMVTGKRKVV